MNRLVPVVTKRRSIHASQDDQDEVLDHKRSSYPSLHKELFITFFLFDGYFFLSVSLFNVFNLSSLHSILFVSIESTTTTDQQWRRQRSNYSRSKNLDTTNMALHDHIPQSFSCHDFTFQQEIDARTELCAPHRKHK